MQKLLIRVVVGLTVCMGTFCNCNVDPDNQIKNDVKHHSEEVIFTYLDHFFLLNFTPFSDSIPSIIDSLKSTNKFSGFSSASKITNLLHIIKSRQKVPRIIKLNAFSIEEKFLLEANKQLQTRERIISFIGSDYTVHEPSLDFDKVSTYFNTSVADFNLYDYGDPFVAQGGISVSDIIFDLEFEHAVLFIHDETDSFHGYDGSLYFIKRFGKRWRILYIESIDRG